MNKRLLKICSLVMALSLISLTFTACKGKDFEKTDVTTTSKTETTVKEETEALGEGVNPLTGEKTLTKDAIGKRPVAIMVENSPAARPQWGLSSPDVVVEGVVEGGITRMMWIYADMATIPKKVGPIRSARHDYVEIADGMNAVFTHWGGSPQAYSYMSSIGLKDVDGKSMGAPYFLKDTTRQVSTEHRGYTSKDKLISAFEKRGIDRKAKGTDWAPYTFSENVRVSFGEKTGSCSSITMTFSSAYKHTFKYNADEKVYYNYMNNKEMKDGNNNQTMKVSNVIIVYCPVNTIPGDDKGRQDWNLTSGDAVFVSNGYGEKVRWEKKGKRAPLKFYGKDGKLLTINKGKTWIGIVPEKNRGLTTITE